MRYQDLVDLLNASNQAEYTASFYRAISHIGFDSAIYGFLPSHEFVKHLNQMPIILATENAPLDYLKYYQENEIFKPETDIFVAKILAGHRDPINWWRDLHGFNPTELQVATLTHAKNEFGLNNGFVVPLMCDHRGYACVTLYSNLSDKDFNHLVQENEEQIGLFCSALNSKIFSDPNLVAELYDNYIKMSDTERQVMRYLVSGKPMKQIEDHIGITYRYAAKVIDKFRKKHGNVPKDKLLYSLGHYFS
ncbi:MULTISPECIES: autoinducer binding domain-containing protein [Pseudoalteromonas]|uniref:autoinducer binding domain-containing protein n=1 Tax=Pseudoalteromonas TaxID=53246 RepID=UPI000BFF17DD|nr:MULTISPECIES: autoinducer binding domain-containing protein [Pseudoalteromonas]MCG9761170.1 LuxR family transcriptional regulator [Pseudoalteromonas sp. Isolate6]MCG9770945.1 LuxR family transcriptional regulator [Pseudoalteromonas piscicida]NKC21228.1 hypothetical protein [Pseudoalteromonas galatheae]PHI34681.1 hypothetical protein CBQ28_23530 [Pseudoalteromonas sp. GCY]QQQ64716.1 autoinducer binding domain-containing protein [Pseudoalteromonas sp. GCY]